MLADFHGLPLDDLTAELERMLANHYAPMRAYASRQFSPPAAFGEVASLSDQGPPCADPGAAGS